MQAMQSAGVRDLFLNKVRLEVAGFDLKSRARTNAALVEWIFVGVMERDKFIILLKVRKRKFRHPTYSLSCRIARPFQSLGERFEIDLAW